MEEKHEVIFEKEKIKIKAIKSYGFFSGADDWYDQEEEEIAFVTKGSAVIELLDRKIRLDAGEYYHFKAREKHRIDFTSGDCEWLCVYISD